VRVIDYEAVPPPIIIAIDGPSGAGKGTVARAVAEELGYRHVDSGAMYRAIGWKASQDGVPLDHEDIIHLRCEARNTLVMRLEPDERIAAQEWIDGLAR